MSEVADQQEKWYYFFLCPYCFRITKSWIEYTEELVSSTYEVVVDNYRTIKLSSDVIDDNFIGSECPMCGTRFDSSACAFEIRISHNLVIEPVGTRWDIKDALTKERNKIIDQFLRWREEHERK